MLNLAVRIATTKLQKT